jgi:hypothetical protein
MSTHQGSGQDRFWVGIEMAPQRSGLSSGKGALRPKASIMRKHRHSQRPPTTCTDQLGDKLRLIPGDCDPPVNLYEWCVCIRNNRVEQLWPITARGVIDVVTASVTLTLAAVIPQACRPCAGHRNKSLRKGRESSALRTGPAAFKWEGFNNDHRH